MIDYAVLGNWVATDESDEARRLRDTLRPMIDSWARFVNDTPRSFFDDWAMEHDHRRRFMMRRKIRRTYR